MKNGGRGNLSAVLFWLSSCYGHTVCVFEGKIMDALVIVDMQNATMQVPRYDVAALVGRLNALSASVREKGGQVIWIRHEDDEIYVPDSLGWQVIASLITDAGDIYIGKTACDGFFHTALDETLKAKPFDRIIFAGCATDFCLDSTVRTAATKGYPVWVPSDGHTTADRPHLKAPQIIAHHNYVWADFIAVNGPVKVVPCQEIMAVG